MLSVRHTNHASENLVDTNFKLNYIQLLNDLPKQSYYNAKDNLQKNQLLLPKNCYRQQNWGTQMIGRYVFLIFLCLCVFCLITIAQVHETLQSGRRRGSTTSHPWREPRKKPAWVLLIFYCHNRVLFLKIHSSFGISFLLENPKYRGRPICFQF